MSDELLTFYDVAKWLGYERPSAVRNWLERNQVPHSDDARGRPITTRACIEAALQTKQDRSAE